MIKPIGTNRQEFLQECRDGKLDGVIAAYRTFRSLSITGLIDQELVNALPTSMKFLAHCGTYSFLLEQRVFKEKEKLEETSFWFIRAEQRHHPPGAGYDEIDVHACSARNPPVRVSNVPTVVDDATATVNMFLILGALRNFNKGMLTLRKGLWRGQPTPTLGHDPQGKVLGILGMGGVGRNLKKKAEVFGMKVIYHNRRELSDELVEGAKYVAFDELLAMADVISLNLPLNVSYCPLLSKKHPA